MIRQAGAVAVTDGVSADVVCPVLSLALLWRLTNDGLSSGLADSGCCPWMTALGREDQCPPRGLTSAIGSGKGPSPGRALTGKMRRQQTFPVADLAADFDLKQPIDGGVFMPSTLGALQQGLG
jgi:hypothetical protein